MNDLQHYWKNYKKSSWFRPLREVFPQSSYKKGSFKEFKLIVSTNLTVFILPHSEISETNGCVVATFCMSELFCDWLTILGSGWRQKAVKCSSNSWTYVDIISSFVLLGLFMALKLLTAQLVVDKTILVYEPFRRVLGRNAKLTHCHFQTDYFW
jgi:hypothetical protein